MTITDEMLNDFRHGRMEGMYAECYASLLAYASRLLTADYAMMAEDSQANYAVQQETMEEELSASIIEQETLDLLHEAIARLPERYRVVFELSYG